MGKTLASVERYVPADKSFANRVITLSLIRSIPNPLSPVEKLERPLASDMFSLLRAGQEWIDGKKTIHVGESGTLYRFLRFASWKYGWDKEFVLEGSLKDRPVCGDRRLIHLPPSKLLELDSGTSQWASAAVLFGNKERVTNPPAKLQLTYEALDYFETQLRSGGEMVLRKDQTILAQMNAFLHFLKTRKLEFEGKHSEDYCFLRAFGGISREKAESVWPSLAGHESNRFEAMERAYWQLGTGRAIDSDDHRVIQAIAMLGHAYDIPMRFYRPASVCKSMPWFWEFIGSASKQN